MSRNLISKSSIKDKSTNAELESQKIKMKTLKSITRKYLKTLKSLDQTQEQKQKLSKDQFFADLFTCLFESLQAKSQKMLFQIMIPNAAEQRQLQTKGKYYHKQKQIKLRKKSSVNSSFIEKINDTIFMDNVKLVNRNQGEHSQNNSFHQKNSIISKKEMIIRAKKYTSVHKNSFCERKQTILNPIQNSIGQNSDINPFFSKLQPNRKNQQFPNITCNTKSAKSGIKIYSKYVKNVQMQKKAKQNTQSLNLLNRLTSIAKSQSKFPVSKPVLLQKVSRYSLLR